jgi:uncharacterized protein (DUF885 family)
MDRRDMLVSSAALAVAAVVPRRAGAATAASPDVAKLNSLLDRTYHRMLDVDPEFCTTLSLDKGDRAAARGKLADRSAAGVTKSQNVTREALAGLRAIDAEKLTGTDRINYDTFAEPYANQVAAMDRFRYGTFSWPEPYTISQLGGAYHAIPDFLINQHPINHREDAVAYLARCEAFAIAIDQESERTRSEYASGVTPPDFVIDKALTQFAAILEPKPEANALVANLVEKTRAKDIPGDWAGRCAALIRDRIYPAMRRQADLLRAARPKAVHDGGVWRLPDGGEFYAYALRYATTTRLTADEIHQLGLDRMAALTAQADAILRQQGMTQGTVAERLLALGKEPRFLYPNTDAGKAKLIADLNLQMIAMQRRLPRAFGKLPKALVEIRRVPPEIEAGAPGGYYQLPAPDGSRPGAYYINLRDTAENARWTLPTLTYHEATPGHHHQIALAQEAEGLPELRKLPLYSVYTEGWGLYAEQLADELGAYEDDPFGKLGFLQSYMFRAGRLVVDTGLHHKRWSREQAIRYMVANTGQPEASMTTEVERYCVWPGQATSYMVGQTRWVGIREALKARMGAKFDLRAFHDTALAAGAMPISVLESMMNRWADARMADSLV